MGRQNSNTKARAHAVMKHNTRSGRYNELPNRRQTTIIQRKNHGNLCENLDDEIKNMQRDITRAYILGMFRFRAERERLNTVSLDTVARRSVEMLESLGMWKNILVDYNKKTALEHSAAGYHCMEGKFNDYVIAESKKMGVVIADSESSTGTMLTCFSDMLDTRFFADKSILFLNASTHDCTGMTMAKYIEEIKFLIEENEDYDIEILRGEKYPCHRNNVITRGAPMFALWMSIVKK